MLCDPDPKPPPGSCCKTVWEFKNASKRLRPIMKKP